MNNCFLPIGKPLGWLCLGKVDGKAMGQYRLDTCGHLHKQGFFLLFFGNKMDMEIFQKSMASWKYKQLLFKDGVLAEIDPKPTLYF